MIEKKQITTLMLVILIIAAIGNSVPNKNSCCDNNHEGPVPKIIDSAEKSKEYNWKNRFRMLFKTGDLKSFTIFIGKHFCWSLFFDRVACMACNLMKKRLRRRCFPVNIAILLRTAF